MAAEPNSFDVVVIGGGPGGYTAAIRARQLGLEAAVANLWWQVLTLGIEIPMVNVQFINEETGYTHNYLAYYNNELSQKWSNLRVIDQDTIATCQVETVDELSASSQSTHGPVELWRIGEVWSYEADSDYPHFPGHWTVTNVPFRFGYVGFRERTYSTEHVEVIQDGLSPLP